MKILSAQTSRQLKQRWTSIATWVDARSLGERAALFGAGAALLIVMTNQLFLNAASSRAAAQGKQMASDMAATRKLQAEIDKLAAQPAIDPDAENKERLKSLQSQEAAAQEAIAALSHDLVPPDQMVSMLESMMARQERLRLVSLAKLPIQSLDTSAGQAKPAASQAAAGATPQASAMVYKHGVEIVLQGQYLDLMNYIAQLEKLPVRVVWGKLGLRVNAYPTATLSLTLYTLSLEKQWLNI
jgi:MSHA biogenesis protein MshJ